MSLKRKIFNIFAAVVMVMGSVPMTFTNVYAAEDEPAGIVPEEGNIPKSLKKVHANGDGTYDITLEIQGVSRQKNNATKANVIVVYDSSGSMSDPAQTYEYNENRTGQYGLVNGDYLVLNRWYSGLFGRRYCSSVGNNYSGTVYSDADCSVTYSGTRYGRTQVEYGTRIQVAADAVNALANQLLSQNDPNNPDFKDVVEMAFIDFDTTVKNNTTHITRPTTDLNTFKSWVSAAGAGGGTNWEDALTVANSVDFGDQDKTYIIFVSDGDPTFRNSQNGAPRSDCYDSDGYGSSWKCNIWGNGQTDPDPYRNYTAAKAIADEIVANPNKELYAVGAFGESQNMEHIGGTYYDAINQDALETAFADIVKKITMGISVADLQIEDGITSATSTEIDGTAGNFRYSVPESWGDDWAEATYDGSSVHWNPGEYKTLTDKQTASVTFTVWPSQEAMDCIASLRNDGTCDESNLTKFGLGVYDDGSFYLITNSIATFRFKTATKVEGSDEIEYSEISIPIEFTEERDPTNLPETELQVTKKWADELDPKQRNDIDEVSLELYVDGKKVRDYVFNEKSEEGSEWTGEAADAVYYYTVAPGVMKRLDNLTAEEAASLRGVANETGGGIVTVNGVEYAILEKGHDYEFANENYDFDEEQNPNSSNHYQITKRTFHPMIVDDGLVHDVVFDNTNKTATIEKVAMKNFRPRIL